MSVLFKFLSRFFSAVTLSREYLKHVAYIATEPQEINSLLSQGFFRFPGCGGHGAMPLRSHAVGSTLN